MCSGFGALGGFQVVFVGARRLSEGQEPGRWVPLAEDDLSPRARQRTPLAIEGGGPEAREVSWSWAVGTHGHVSIRFDNCSSPRLRLVSLT